MLLCYGYHTSFIYGGESRFDNMKGWYLGNSFDKVIDQEKFQNPNFVGTWGICDEEVTQRANKEFKSMYKKGEKFVTVMFSTSNHSPYDFPDGKIDLVENVAKKSVKNAVRYADYVIGAFIDQARKEDYYKDTIFVVVADHNIRVYGDALVPVRMFHIPGMILSKDLKPLNYTKLATQPDLLATSLDLLGLDLEYPIMGNSIFNDKKQEISLMQYYDAYALRKKDKIAIVRPGKQAVSFKYENEKLYPIKHEIELEKDALAFIIVLNDLYQKKLYK